MKLGSSVGMATLELMPRSSGPCSLGFLSRLSLYNMWWYTLSQLLSTLRINTGHGSPQYSPLRRWRVRRKSQEGSDTPLAFQGPFLLSYTVISHLNLVFISPWNTIWQELQDPWGLKWMTYEIVVETYHWVTQRSCCLVVRISLPGCDLKAQPS
jgi:hypothetical protein